MAKQNKGKSRSVYFKDSHLWTKIEHASADQNRSVNNYIETVMQNHLIEKK